MTTPKPVFFSAHPTGEIRQNSKAIADDLECVIIKVTANKISAIITDNASVMKKAWRILEVKYPKIIFLGCIAHNLNLLVGDIMKLRWAANIMNDSKQIIKYFKTHNIPSAILKRHQIASYSTQISLKYPVKTRWGSAAISLNSIATNRLALQLASVELINNRNINIPEDISDTIESEDFWRDIELLLSVLDELVVGISMFESDTPKLALFYQWFRQQMNSNGM